MKDNEYYNGQNGYGYQPLASEAVPSNPPGQKQIVVEQYCDGWCVNIDGNRFYWNHNDEDLGTQSIRELLEYLGHSVEVEEVY
jgi:hypothetical protein